MAEEANIIDEIAGPEEAIPADEETTVEEQEAAPEAVEEEKPEAKADHHVPVQVLQEERARRQELQQKLDQTSERMAKMEALWEQLQKQNAPKEDIPAYEDDPAGHLNAKIATLQKQLEGITGERAKEREAQQAQATERQMLEQYAGSVRSFSLKTPDFNDAYQYLAKVIDDDLQARGISDPVERTRMMQYEEGLMVGRVMRQGGDPAELIYNYAKSRGYKQAKEEDKLERIEKGQKAAMSLSTANGKTEAVTLERLAELADQDPDAFDREWEAARRKGVLG